jgi:glycogen synthase
MDASAKHISLRILMTTDTVGGVWSYSLELCKALRSYGVRFYLITTGAPMQPAQKAEVAALENVTVYETDFLLEWMEAPWQSIDASAGWLLKLEQELLPDLIHLNGYAYGALSWNAPVVMVAHSDVFSWWDAVKGEAPPAVWREYFKRVCDGLHGADFLVAPSQTVMRWMRAIYSAKIPGKVIYNGRAAADFYPGSKEPFVFSMGRIWDEAKNIQLLVQAAPQIKHPIKVAGDNSFAANAVSTDATNITYLGKLTTPEVAATLAAASVYVLPARYEPFGLSVLEAALSGCALVLGDIDTLREIWNDSALYVDTNDANALAAVVNYLMENEAVRKQYVQKALERAHNYSSEIMAANYLQVYQQVVQPKEVTQKLQTY